MDLIEVSENQNRHPWELSRTHCILKELKKLKINGNVLDIGCGDSYFDRRLIAENPNLTVYGIDINLKEEIHEGNLHALNDLAHLPDMKFDFVLMMDVLEHIEDDGSYLKMISDKFVYGGGDIFLTVPAFQSLYSLHDEQLKHFRRYNHGQLKNVIMQCGLKEEKWSYFYFSLVFARLLTKNKTENLSQWQKEEGSFATRFVTWVLNTDFALCTALSKIGLHLPGLSLMAVCKVTQ